jgi:ArsR family transcriptional regulator
MNRVYEALAHPTRREILALLREDDLTAGQIAEHFPIAKPTLSGHLRVLREAGLIEGERNGTSITYHLHLSLLENALAALMQRLQLAPGPHAPTPEAQGRNRAQTRGQRQ